MINLEGRRALVTGGSRGIGKAIVLKLCSLGCNVVFTYASNEEAALLTENESGNKAKGIKADAGSFEDAKTSFDFAISYLGGLDILVNNAGITRDNLIMRMSEEEFDSVITANLKSVFNYSKLAVSTMMSQRKGSIINITSVVGITGNAGQSNYAASKAGVAGFTKSLAKEVASRNITVNAIAPGFISTDMTGKLKENQKEVLMSLIPLKKFGEPEYIADAVAFLASDSAKYITGQILSVDGGMTM